MLRICEKCNKKKELEEFHNNKRHKSGKCYICKDCFKLFYCIRKIYPVANITEKECADCHEVKTVDQFYKKQANKDGYSKRCKSCEKIYDQKRCNQHKGSLLEGEKRCASCKEVKDVSQFTKRLRNTDGLRSRCVDCDRKSESSYRKLNPGQRFKNRIRQKYNLELDVYEKMLQDQNNKCYICDKQTTLFIDHCHKSNKIRKLLCQQCNAGIGFFYENISFLENAILYLKEHNEPETEMGDFASARHNVVIGRT